MPISKARLRKLSRSFNKGSGKSVRQFSQRRKPKVEKVKALTLNWIHQIVKIMRKRPSLSEEIEITLENGAFLIDEMTSAYIIAE
mgnify:CR=1 FL=1